MLVFFGMKKAHAWEPSILTHLTRICLFLILFRYLTAPLPYKVLRKPLKQPLCPTKYILWCEFVRGGTRNQTQERSPWFRQPYVLPTLEALTAETLGIGKRTMRNVHHSLRKQRTDWVSKETAIWLCPDNQIPGYSQMFPCALCILHQGHILKKKMSWEREMNMIKIYWMKNK